MAFKALQVQVPEGQQAMVGFGSEASVLDTLDGALKGREFLVGDSFTAADLYIGAHLSWGMDFGTIEKRPVFEAYVTRLLARPAAVRANEIDDALMPADPAKVSEPAE